MMTTYTEILMSTCTFFCLFLKWVIKEESQAVSWICSTIGTSTGASLFRTRLRTGKSSHTRAVTHRPQSSQHWVLASIHWNQQGYEDPAYDKAGADWIQPSDYLLCKLSAFKHLHFAMILPRIALKVKTQTVNWHSYHMRENGNEYSKRNSHSLHQTCILLNLTNLCPLSTLTVLLIYPSIIS